MLKIIFSENVDYGLPDHLVDASCRGVLQRLQKDPIRSYTHRTGQGLVWGKFVELLKGDYKHLSALVEFHTVEGKIDAP